MSNFKWNYSNEIVNTKMASYFNTEAETLLNKIRSNTPPNPIYTIENEMHKIARAAII